MMKNGSRIAIAAGLLIVLCAGTASAGSLYLGNPGSNYRSGSGGEFYVKGYTDTFSTPGHTVFDSATNFHTFCVEKDETINLNGNYNYDVNTTSIHANGGTQNRALLESTARLFQVWYQGYLPQYEYVASSGRAASAADFQEVIWFFQGGGTIDTGTSYGDLSDDTGLTTGFGIAYSSFNAEQKLWAMLGQYWDDEDVGIGGTRILNLYTGTAADGNRVEKQDQLVWTGGDDITLVPLPSAAIVGLAMLGGLGFCYRLRRRRNAA